MGAGGRRFKSSRSDHFLLVALSAKGPTLRLQKLILHGFKSFRDKTVIHFNDGITGVVGPNGCGKSNVVDALFWVMGEQSPKHLRGQSMQDLIFSGSQKYPPAAWAQVSLVLSNEEKRVIELAKTSLSPTEVELTRKIYRSGETEYRINNIPCRLKDIQEFFMDTGAGVKSYSVIAQGEISRLIQAKPHEKRIMIEEVAGVAKFKQRKKESLKKMQKTRDNLERISDLIQEVDKNLGRLQEQSAITFKAKALKEAISEKEFIYFSNKGLDLIEKINHAQEKIQKQKDEYQGFSSEKNLLEIEISKNALEKTEYESSRNTLIAAVQADEKKLSLLEQSLEHSHSNLKNYQSFLEKINEDKEIITEDLAQYRKLLEQSEKNYSGLGSENNSPSLLEEHPYLQAKEELVHLQSQYEVAQKNLLDTQKEVSILEEEFLYLERELNALSDQKIAQEKRYQENLTNKNDFEKLYQTQSDEIVDLEKKIITQEEEKKALIEKENQSLQAIKNLEEELQENQILKTSVTSRLNSLESLKYKGLGHKDSFFEENKKYDFLADTLEVPEKYTEAVQLILRDVETFVGLSGLGEVENTLSLEEGVSAFIPRPQELEYSFNEGVELSKIVQEKENIQIQVSSLFAGIFYIDQFDLNRLGDLTGKIRGLYIEEYKSLYLTNSYGDFWITNKDDNAEGLVWRNQEINKLKGEGEKYIALTNDLEGKLKSLQTQYQDICETKNTKEEALSLLKEKFNEVNQNYLLTQERNKQHANAMEEAKNGLEKIADEVHNFLDKKKEHQVFIDDKKALLSERTTGLKTLTEKIERQKRIFSEYEDDYWSLKNTVESQESERESLIASIEKNKEQLLKLELRLQNTLEERETYESQREEVRLNIEKIKQENIEVAKSFAGHTESLKNVDAQYEKVRSLENELKNKLKVVDSKILEIDKKVFQVESKLERDINEKEILEKDFFDKFAANLELSCFKTLEWSVDPAHGESLFGNQTVEIARRDDWQSYQKEYRQLTKELDGLGTINWYAIEEFEKAKERFDFLTTQKEQLNSSLNDLDQAIQKLDKKCVDRFNITFKEVNERFQKVFPIIFGGGKANLELIENQNDDEEGVEIKAMPPGKKMQNINLLSGGEKAMTAMSLIFSIFLVRPSPFCLLDEVDAPLDDANIGRFNRLLQEMGRETQFVLITHNRKTMELNDSLYGITMQEPGVSTAVSVELSA